jgi:hypothetical protein
VDIDAKKMERFRDGLDCKLYERLNLIEPNDFHDLVNKAISQEDAMKKAQRDKKRQAGSVSRNGMTKKFHFVKKNVPNPSQQSSIRRWTMIHHKASLGELPVQQRSAAGSQASCTPT